MVVTAENRLCHPTDQVAIKIFLCSHCCIMNNKTVFNRKIKVTKQEICTLSSHFFFWSCSILFLYHFILKSRSASCCRNPSFIWKDDCLNSESPILLHNIHLHRPGLPDMTECLQSFPVVLEHQVDHHTGGGPADRDRQGHHVRKCPSIQFYQPAPTEDAVDKTFSPGGDCGIQELCHFHEVSGSERITKG